MVSSGDELIRWMKKNRKMLAASFLPIYIFLIHKSFTGKSFDVVSYNNSIPEECKDEIVLNGSFEEGTKGWKYIGPATGMKLVAGTSGNALSTVTREQWFFGQAQNVNKDCFGLGTSYVISADVKIEDYDGNPVSCDPFNKYFSTETCPHLAIKLTGEKEVASHDVGFPVGPWKLGEWNKIYGIFEATTEFYHQQNLELYVTKAAKDRNVIIDNVSLKPVNQDTFGVTSCNNLIRNGNADIGDSRFWRIKGNGDAGEIRVESPGASGKYAFLHRGERKSNFNGMWQEIDQKCMYPDSAWKISFKMILLDSAGIETSCDKTQFRGDASCPNVMVESHTVDKGLASTIVHNEAPGHWESTGWNTFEGTFTVTSDHLAKDETSIFINNVPSSYGYKIDDFTMTRWLSP